MSDCVCCGNYVPEGLGMVCHQCMHKNAAPNVYVGDKVYVPDHYYGRWFADDQPLTVMEVVTRKNKKGERITCILNMGIYDFEVPCNMCFHSYEEEKKWCDKENGKCTRLMR